MSSGIEEMEDEMMQELMQVQDFRYDIAKILQGLRKFCNNSENLAILAKFLYGYIFAIIAKVTVHCENSNFRYACNFFYDSEISLCAKFSAFVSFDPKDLVFSFSHIYPHCNYSSVVILVFHMFGRLYKPL